MTTPLTAPNDLDLRDFERSLRARNRSPRTIQSYLEAAGQLAELHPAQPVVSLSRRDIEDYLAAVIAKHSPSTAAVRFRSLQQLYKWAVAEDLIPASPMVGMSVPSVPEQPVPVVGMEDLRLLLKTCEADRSFDGRRDAAVLRLFLEPGGLRLSELTGLALADVDLTTDAVLVTGKRGRQRVVPFGSKTGSALTRYLRARTTHRLHRSPALWLGGRGKPLTPSGVAQMLRRRCEQAGVAQVHPHQLRHSSAHYWLSAGGSDGDAMRLFGWRSREMLNRYGASLADERAQESARRLNLGDRI